MHCTDCTSNTDQSLASLAKCVESIEDSIVIVMYCNIINVLNVFKENTFLKIEELFKTTHWKMIHWNCVIIVRYESLGKGQVLTPPWIMKINKNISGCPSAKL